MAPGMGRERAGALRDPGCRAGMAHGSTAGVLWGPPTSPHRTKQLEKQPPSSRLPSGSQAAVRRTGVREV